MLTQRTANLIFSFILILLVLYMGWLAWGFKTPALGSASLPTHFFPLVLLGFILFCNAIYSYQYWRWGEAGGDADEVVYASKKQAKSGLLTLIAIVASYYLWLQFGFVVAGLFATPAITLAMGNRDLWQLLIITIAALGVFLIFRYGIGTQFA